MPLLFILIYSWDFFLKSGNDVGFAIHRDIHRNDNNRKSMIPILSPARIDSFPVEGEIRIEEPGLCRLQNILAFNQSNINVYYD